MSSIADDVKASITYWPGGTFGLVQLYCKLSVSRPIAIVSENWEDEEDPPPEMSGVGAWLIVTFKENPSLGPLYVHVNVIGVHVMNSVVSASNAKFG